MFAIAMPDGTFQALGLDAAISASLLPEAKAALTMTSPAKAGIRRGARG